jgi:dolichol-phosphate mannosyltransferase
LEDPVTTGSLALITLIRTLLRRRLVRFALVGGAGIPINMAFLWFFHSLLRMPLAPAWICAFEPSALINFYANQRFTYHEQTHLRGWDWPMRALKAQASSLSGQVVNVLAFALLMALGVHYLPADAAGIVVAFTANFLLANRFVFTPARHKVAEMPVSVSEFESVA